MREVYRSLEPVEVADARALLSSPSSMLSPRERIDAADALTGYYRQCVLPLVQKTFVPLSYEINRRLAKMYSDRGILFADFPQDDLWDVTMVVVDKRLHCQCYVESPSGSPIRAGSIIRAIRRVTDRDGKHVSDYVKRANGSPASCVGYVTKKETRLLGPFSNVPKEDWPVAEDDGDTAPGLEDLYHAIMDDDCGLNDVLADPDLSLVAPRCLSYVRELVRMREESKWSDANAVRQVETLYLFGASRTGKSTAARAYLAGKCGANGFFPVTDYARDPFQGYDPSRHRGLLLDELRLPTPALRLSDVNGLLDRFPFQLPRRYSNSYAAFEHVVITSNWSPSEQIESVMHNDDRGSWNEEDRISFYRRLTHILYVFPDGSIDNQTASYHAKVADRSFVTLDDVREALTPKPVPASGTKIITAEDVLGITS